MRRETYEEKPEGEETGMSWEKECHSGFVLRRERLSDLAVNSTQLGGTPGFEMHCLKNAWRGK